MLRQIVEAAVEFNASVALSLVVKATLVIGLALIAARRPRQGRASVRHLLLASAFGVLLVLPLVVFVSPPMEVRIPLAPPDAPVLLDTDARTAGAVPSAAASVDDVAHLAPENQIAGSTLLVAMWAVGVVISLMRVAAGLWQARRVLLESTPWHEARAITREMSRNLGVRRTVAIVLHEAASGPMTCGVLRPAVVFPLDARGWSHEELSRAIIHELEHVRRLDWLTLCLARVVCALYWFHPLAWIAFRQFRLEAERACDDAVLHQSDAAEYAEQLVALAERLTARGHQPLIAMANHGDLSARVRALLDGRQLRGRAGSRVVAGIALSTALFAGLIGPRYVLAIVRPDPPAGALVSQDAAVAPTFEVASVKPSLPDDKRPRMGMWGSAQPGGRWTSRNATLENIIRAAYPDHPLGDQVVGGPDWVRSMLFDISAKAPGETATRQELEAMMRTLLADRFRLALRREVRDLPGYSLVLARSDGRLGPRLRTAAIDCPAIADARWRGESVPSASARQCAVRVQDSGALLRIEAGGVPLSRLAGVLGPRVGGLIVDQTGLTGSFDVSLEFSTDLSASQPSDTPSLFTALPEQLGLRLERRRVPTEVLVIESVELPTTD